MTTTINDVVQTDGSIIRTVTIVNTQTFSAVQYANIIAQQQIQLTNQQASVANITAQIAAMQPIAAQAAKAVSAQITPPQSIQGQPS